MVPEEPDQLLRHMEGIVEEEKEETEEEEEGDELEGEKRAAQPIATPSSPPIVHTHTHTHKHYIYKKGKGKQLKQQGMIFYSFLIYFILFTLFLRTSFK